MYGSMLGGLLPDDKSISYESHIAGACLGIILAFLFKDKDPELPRKQYSWEIEDESDFDERYIENDKESLLSIEDPVIKNRKNKYLH
jgi:hypothetical protein